MADSDSDHDPIPRCTATKADGNPCHINAYLNGFCVGHYRASLPPEERQRLASEAGKLPKHGARIVRTLRSPGQILTYCEETSRDVTSATADVAKARMTIAQVALKCIEIIRADKERKRKEAADDTGFGFRKAAV